MCWSKAVRVSPLVAPKVGGRLVSTPEDGRSLACALQSSPSSFAISSCHQRKRADRHARNPHRQPCLRRREYSPVAEPPPLHWTN